MYEGVSRRLAREFSDKIRTGAWPVGERVPTTRELAAAYGVSVNTIQSAFRELQASDLIERRPRLGGFVKSRNVRVITSPRATTIGVVIHHAGHGDASGTWADRIIRGCSRELASAGFHVALFTFDDQDPDALARLLAKIDEAGETLGGVLYFTNVAIPTLPRELDKRNIGWVTINPAREHAVQNFVSQDASRAGRLIARCAARMGVQRVMFLGDRFHGGRSTPELYLGFMRAWLDRGRRSRDVDVLHTDVVDEMTGFEVVQRYLRTDPRPDLIVGSGDYIAIGAARAMREAGIEVGRDVYVLGATGLELAEFAHPSLTVSAVPMEALGREAARMLLEMAREGVRRLVGRYLQAKLIARESWPIPADVLEEEIHSIAEEDKA
jgi:LacI family transcriptional regulator